LDFGFNNEYCTAFGVEQAQASTGMTPTQIRHIAFITWLLQAEMSFARRH
jgi:hypothetical protein